MTNELPGDYDNFINSLRDTIKCGKKSLNEQTGVARTLYYFNIGSIITSFSLNNNLQLNKKFISKLTEEAGVSRSHLFLSVQLSRLYTKEFITTHPSISWGHYRELITILDSALRDELENRIINESLSTREFSALVHRHRRPLDNRTKLELPALSLNTYRVKHIDNISFIDLGFSVYNSSYDISAPFVVVTRDNNNNPQVTPTDRITESCYTYRAEVLKVVDADTFIMRIDHGLNTYTIHRFRLRGIDAPESETPEGEIATDFVTSMIPPGKKVIIRTYRTDIYGRYLIDLIYHPTSDDPDKIITDGIFLNSELLDNGFATLY